MEEQIFGGDCAGACMYKQAYHFVENSAHLVLNTELLLTMLSNFEREVALKASAI